MGGKFFVVTALCIIFICAVTGCSGMKQNETANANTDDSGNKKEEKRDSVWSGITEGIGKSTNIGPNSYSIEVIADIISGSAGNMYKKFDKTSQKACNGSYKVMERQLIHDSSGSGRSDRLVGTIECGTASKAVESENPPEKSDKPAVQPKKPAVQSKKTAVQTKNSKKKVQGKTKAEDSSNKKEENKDSVWSGITEGIGKSINIGPNSYSIEVIADIISGSAGNMYKKFDKTAQKACKGSYKVMERQLIHDSSGVGKSDRLVGTVECR